MQLDDLTIEVRNDGFQRVGKLVAADLVGFTSVIRLNDVGSWKVPLPVGHPVAEELRKPGAGIVVTGANGVLFSGPTRSVLTEQNIENPVGNYVISGVTDDVILSERLAYPTPSTANVSAQTTPYDVRTGLAEDVMKAYVTANIGASAPSERIIPILSVEATSSLGTTVTGSARFQPLQDLLKGLADVAELGYTLVQESSGLVFKVYQLADQTDFIRLDIDNDKLTKSEYTYSSALVTRVIVGGAGDGASRTFIERVSTDSLAAEGSWSRRIERFNDQRSTTDTTQLQQAADEMLSVDGKTQISVSISPSDDETMLFGSEWNLGDKITCVIGSTEIQSVVTEVGISIGSDGVRVGATVGEPRGQDYESQMIARQSDQLLRISKLERQK